MAEVCGKGQHLRHRGQVLVPLLGAGQPGRAAGQRLCERQHRLRARRRPELQLPKSMEGMRTDARSTKRPMTLEILRRL